MDEPGECLHNMSKRARTSSYRKDLSLNSVNVMVNLAKSISEISRNKSSSSECLVREKTISDELFYCKKFKSSDHLSEISNPSLQENKASFLQYRIEKDSIDKNILDKDTKIQATITYVNDESLPSAIQTTFTYYNSENASIVYSTSRINVYSNSSPGTTAQSNLNIIPQVDLTVTTTMQISNDPEKESVNISVTSLNTEKSNFESNCYSDKTNLEINLGTAKSEIFSLSDVKLDKTSKFETKMESSSQINPAHNDVLVSKVLITSKPTLMPLSISSHSQLPQIPSRIPVLPNRNLQTFPRSQHPCQIKNQQFSPPQNFISPNLLNERPRSSFQLVNHQKDNNLSLLRNKFDLNSSLPSTSGIIQAPFSRSINFTHGNFISNNNLRPIQLPIPKQSPSICQQNSPTQTSDTSEQGQQQQQPTRIRQNIDSMLMPIGSGSINPWINHLQMIGITQPVIRTTQLISHSNLHAQVFRTTSPHNQEQNDSAPRNMETLNLIFDYFALENKGLTKEELDKLPTRIYKVDENQIAELKEDENGCYLGRCMICLEDFIENESLLRALICKHEFHADCVDKWLHTKRSCPLCRADASDPHGIIN